MLRLGDRFAKAIPVDRRMFDGKLPISGHDSRSASATSDFSATPDLFEDRPRPD